MYQSTLLHTCLFTITCNIIYCYSYNVLCIVLYYLVFIYIQTGVYIWPVVVSGIKLIVRPVIRAVSESVFILYSFILQVSDWNELVTSIISCIVNNLFLWDRSFTYYYVMHTVAAVIMVRLIVYMLWESLEAYKWWFMYYISVLVITIFGWLDFMYISLIYIYNYSTTLVTRAALTLTAVFCISNKAKPLQFSYSLMIIIHIIHACTACCVREFLHPI